MLQILSRPRDIIRFFTCVLCELEIVTKIFLLNYKTKHDTVLYVCLLEHPRLISYFVQQFLIINIVALVVTKKKNIVALVIYLYRYQIDWVHFSRRHISGIFICV